MPVFTFQNSTCLFVHIPKAAGTAFENAVVDNGWTKHFSINGLSTKQISFMKVTPQHFHAELLESVFNLECFSEIIIIVRDPVARMKSEFYWQETSGQTKLPAETWIDHAFESYTVDPTCYDNHLRPQVEFIPPNDQVQIFKLEEDGISDALDLVLSHGSRSTLKNAVKQRLRSRRASKVSRYRAEVEEAFIERVYDIRHFYERDCKILGYSV